MDQKEANYRLELTELEAKLADPSVFSDPAYPKLAKRRSDVADIVTLFDERAKLAADKAASLELRSGSDAELREMANLELEELEPKIALNEQTLIDALTPTDPNNDRDVIIEIRAAAGGDESALFAGELYRMYARWAENHGFKTELISESPSEAGGFKEIVFAVRGGDAYKN